MGITLEQVSKHYQKEILHDISISFPEQGLILLTGPSGEGKTTLAHMILGILKPDSGKVLGIEGMRFSAVFQEDRLFEDFTIADNINAPCKDKLSDSQLNALLQSLGLEGTAHQYPGELSGGMKRRVAFARALAFDGDFFLLDEPFSGLDEKAKALVSRQILSLCQKKAVLLITHAPELFYPDAALVVKLENHMAIVSNFSKEPLGRQAGGQR